MEKKMNNKGFSLVELIIVVAIMAVLIGVLAPTYLKYVENSKRTSDCSTLGSVLDACEVIAIDPASDWGSGASLSISVSTTNGVTTVTIPDLADATLGYDEDVRAIVGLANGTATIELQAAWEGDTITATKGMDGTVVFDAADLQAGVDWDDASAVLVDQLNEFAPTLAARFE